MILNTVVFGGGGSGLALNVVAYATAAIRDASTPSENTIGIVSSTAVSSYYFGSTAPTTGLADGLVWIKTGIESPTPVPADSLGKVMLYPLAAEQYQSSVWVSVDAKCYQNGEWSYWYKKLFTDGTQDVAWTAQQACTIGSEYIFIGQTSSAVNRGSVCTTNTVDLTEYSTLKFEYVCGGTYPSTKIGYGAVSTKFEYDAYVTVNSETRTVGSLDISSANCSAYIKASNVSTHSNTKKCYIYRVWLEA